MPPKTIPELSLDWDTHTLSQCNEWLYQDVPSFLFRQIQSLRPYICPFSEIVKHIQPQTSALDMGCGSGLLLANLALRKAISKGIGIDVSNKTIRAANFARRRLLEQATKSPELQFELRSPKNLWPNAQFDNVCVIDVIHHVPKQNQIQFLKNAYQCISPGGKLIYKDMTKKGLFKPLANRIHDLIMAQQWINYLPIERVSQTMTEMGAIRVHSMELNIGPYGHELQVFQKP